MNTIKLLAEWMEHNGFTNRTLAGELGFTYDLLYAVTNGKRPISDGFRWRFAQRFGWDVAQSIFVATPINDPEAAQPA